MILRFVALAVMLTGLLLPAPDLDRQSARIAALEESFLAPCCWAEPVAHHRSEVALKMKAEIGRWVAEGRSDQEITDTYKQRYGARVLVEPQGAQWWWLQLIPWAAAALGLAFTVWALRRMLGPPIPS